MIFFLLSSFYLFLEQSLTFPEHDAVGLTFTGGAGAALATLSSKVRTRMGSMSSFILIIASPGADEIQISF